MLLSILQTLLLLLITAGTAYLVLGRYKGGAHRTRQSLRSRRREVYGDVLRILTVLSQTGDLRKEELLDFRSRTQDAALLFDEEIAAYLEDIYARGVKLMSTNELLKGASLPVGEDRDRITVENSKQMIWLADQLSLLGKKFQHYTDVL